MLACNNAFTNYVMLQAQHWALDVADKSYKVMPLKKHRTETGSDHSVEPIELRKAVVVMDLFTAVKGCRL